MIEFLRRMFAPERSSETAKERLKLVLLSDHLSLAPDVVAALKRDLLEVISRYVEIDPAHADVTFEQRDREVAMLASIPITGMRERGGIATTDGSAPAPAVRPEAEIVVPAAVVPDAAVAPDAIPARGVAVDEGEATARGPDVDEAETPRASVATAPVPRRRKRRRKAAPVVPRSAPAHGVAGFDPA